MPVGKDCVWMKLMMLRIGKRNIDGVTVLDLNGLLVDPGENTLRTAIANVLQEGTQRILLNMTDVRYINSPGIGELVSAYTRARNLGAWMKLFGLTKKARDLLQITKLFTVWEVFDSEADAVRSFLHDGSVLTETLRCLCPVCGYVANPAFSDKKGGSRKRVLIVMSDSSWRLVESPGRT